MTNQSSPERMIEVPSSASFPELWQFALTYDGYRHHSDAAKIGNRCVEAWMRNSSLPDDLDTARCALFFEQRRYRHFGSDPEEPVQRYLSALLGRIRELSGGSVVAEQPIL